MNCPRCDGKVAFTMAGATLRMFDAQEHSTVVATIREDGLIGDTHHGWVIKEHVCPDEEEPDIEELRDAWWRQARARALRYECPEVRCGAHVGVACKDLRITKSEPRYTEWPHDVRVAIALTPDEYQEGLKNGWIS